MHTYLLNLATRADRKAHSEAQFVHRPEFEVTFITPLTHPKPTHSLWLTLCGIVQKEMDVGSDYFIFCEDDHQFTDDYNFAFLKQSIDEAAALNADILSGWVSWQSGSVMVAKKLFWVQHFSGLQFIVIFKTCYQKILDAVFNEHDIADHKIASLTERKLVIFPTISTQKEFGYSDVTPGNNTSGRVDSLFQQTQLVFQTLQKVHSYFKPCIHSVLQPVNINEILLPVYIINLKERAERLAHVKKQFQGREEFEITVINAIKDENARRGLWKSIVKAVQAAITNDDDFFILCEDDHQFTNDYNKEDFIKAILQGYYQKQDLMSGGIGGFGQAAPAGDNRYWVDWFWCTQFIVVYKQFYEKISNYNFSDTDTADGVFSTLANNKTVLYPFISTQKDFGYSDVTLHNNQRGKITHFFETAANRLQMYHRVQQHYILKTDTGNDPIVPPIMQAATPYIHHREVHRSNDAQEIVPYIVSLLQPKSVVDFGCGPGHFLAVFQQHGIKNIQGIDGHWINKDVLQINGSQFLESDISMPIILQQRYDLVLCLEVAEHLPPSAADTLVQSLTAAGDVILFSAAIPGQGGQNHINEHGLLIGLKSLQHRDILFMMNYVHNFGTTKTFFGGTGKICSWL